MILDTNALSAFVDGEAGVGDLVRHAGRVAVPVVVLGEFLYGISRSRHRRHYEDWLAAHLPGFEVFRVTEETAAVYARVRGGLRRAGRPIPANDLWIAALALQHGMPVVSRDGHFDVVPGLARRPW